MGGAGEDNTQTYLGFLKKSQTHFKSIYLNFKPVPLWAGTQKNSTTLPFLKNDDIFVKIKSIED